MKEITGLAFVVAAAAFPLSVLMCVVVFAAKVADLGLMMGASWLWVPAPLLLSPALFIGIVGALGLIYGALSAIDSASGR